MAELLKICSIIEQPVSCALLTEEPFSSTSLDFSGTEVYSNESPQLWDDKIQEVNKWAQSPYLLVATPPSRLSTIRYERKYQPQSPNNPVLSNPPWSTRIFRWFNSSRVWQSVICPFITLLHSREKRSLIYNPTVALVCGWWAGEVLRKPHFAMIFRVILYDACPAGQRNPPEPEYVGISLAPRNPYWIALGL